MARLGDAGGTFKGGPAAVSWGQGEHRIDVFVRGQDDHLGHLWFDGKKPWHGWEDLGGPITSAPAVSSWAGTPRRLDVFAAGPDGQLVHKWHEGSTWHDWQTLGGKFKGAPAAVSWGMNRIDVFVQGMDGTSSLVGGQAQEEVARVGGSQRFAGRIARPRIGTGIYQSAACGYLMGVGATRRVLRRAHGDASYRPTGVGPHLVG